MAHAAASRSLSRLLDSVMSLCSSTNLFPRPEGPKIPWGNCLRIFLCAIASGLWDCQGGWRRRGCSPVGSLGEPSSTMAKAGARVARRTMRLHLSCSREYRRLRLVMCHMILLLLHRSWSSSMSVSDDCRYCWKSGSSSRVRCDVRVRDPWSQPAASPPSAQTSRTAWRWRVIVQVFTVRKRLATLMPPIEARGP